MAVSVDLSNAQAFFNEKLKNPIKGNVSVDVYMYYHVRGFFFYSKIPCGIKIAFFSCTASS